MDQKTANLLLGEAQHIKGQLALKGWTLSAIDRDYDLSAGTARNTLRQPNESGEAAIADALGVHPMTLWTLRYNSATGQRLSPQPRKNYARPPTIPQRRKNAEAQT